MQARCLGAARRTSADADSARIARPTSENKRGGPQPASFSSPTGCYLKRPMIFAVTFSHSALDSVLVVSMT